MKFVKLEVMGIQVGEKVRISGQGDNPWTGAKVGYIDYMLASVTRVSRDYIEVFQETLEIKIRFPIESITAIHVVLGQSK